MKKKLVFTASFIFLTFNFSACSLKKEATGLKKVKQEESFSKNYENIVDDGYTIGDYHFYFANFQKKDSETIKNNLQDFDSTIVKNFETYQYKIDKTKKINMLPFRIQYNPTDETIRTNYFLINNTNTKISSIDIEGLPKLKNIDIVEPTTISFSDEDFLQLPTNGFISFSVTMSMPIEYIESLKENKVNDLSFDIIDLKINGEKVDNSNEH
ncbi:hypothetical protein [Enterococcus rivorum]|uniref:Lipoprotein n=1 Tax=Enterococcus rivorum TaxID=762845 RepID=A0A1E5KV33_9ENTE|nr:hypothetical protein [Enterococcus rivorum]MBP2099089.1 hypothetical protein [Enterococcus rivorum]OEH81658.1 hypothetical protein BCR26_15950 [Enterococcus rivorum]